MKEAILNSVEKDTTIQQLFEKQVSLTPDDIAVVFENQSITYQELNNKINFLAKRLKEHNIKPNTLVGILQHRSIELIISIFAVIKAGCSYLPIDPDYPHERINYILDNSQASTILVDNHITFENSSINSLNVNTILKDAVATANPKNESAPEDLLYVIYTSGTTGNPKGVMISQGSLVNFLESVAHIIDYRHGKSFISVTTICFDMFVLDLYLPLVSGMTFYLANEEEQMNAEALYKIIETYHINMIQTTPSRYKLLLNTCDLPILNNFTDILLGGEMLPPQLLKKLQSISNARIFNLYGPTETTVYSAIKELTNATEITVGMPIKETQLYILDENLNEVPAGEKGELYIGGKGLALGYLHNPKLTAERFINNPFSPGSKLYKTGDIAQLSDSSEYMILGRNDSQIKLHGFRVELAEIEDSLTQIPAISEAAVIVNKNCFDSQVLYAFYVKSAEITEGDIRESLSNSLPYYMIPNFFIEIEKIPLTPNGKLDRLKLPAMIPHKDEDTSILEDFSSLPFNEQIIAILKDILGLSTVDTSKSFIQLGGDSILAITFMSQIQKYSNATFSIADILKSASIDSLISTHLDIQNKQLPKLIPCDKQNQYPISTEQQTFFIATVIYEKSIWYNIPATLKISGALDVAKLKSALSALITRHEALRTQFVREGNSIHQIIHENYDLELDIINCKNEELDTVIKEFVKPFEMLSFPLFRIKLLTLTETEHILLLDFHHSIFDGASFNVLLNDLQALYFSEKLEPLTISNKDYAAWQKEVYASEIGQSAKNWTFEKLTRLPFLQMPLDSHYQLTKDFTGGKHVACLSSELSTQITDFCKKYRITVNTFFSSVYLLFLHKTSSATDILLGSYCSNRRLHELQKMVGVVGNLNPIRFHVNPKLTFAEFLNETNEELLQAYSHINFDFNRAVMKNGMYILKNFLCEICNVSLYQHALVYHSETTVPLVKENNGLTFSLEELYLDSSPLDINMHIYKQDSGQYKFVILYNNHIFLEESIVKGFTYLQKLINMVLADPAKTLSDYVLYNDLEKKVIRTKRQVAKRHIRLHRLLRNRDAFRFWCAKIKKMLH